MKSLIFSLRFLILSILLYQFVDITTCENSDEDIRDDNAEQSMNIVVDNETNACTRRQNSQLHEITAANPMQFPFMAAIMSQTNEYICSGSVVSNGLILTTAQCTSQSVSYVLLNATKDKKEDTVVMLHVSKTEKFPTYTGDDMKKDIGLIYTEKHNSSVASKIRLSNFTSARHLTDVEGIGYGLNSETGQPRELQFIRMEHRYRGSEPLSVYFDCIDTDVLTCYKDTGGPVIVDNELVGIVVKGQDSCIKKMTSSYAVNERMADIIPTYSFKAWLDEKIKRNEEQEIMSLPTYPLKPNMRERKTHKMTSSKANNINPAVLYVFISVSYVYLA